MAIKITLDSFLAVLKRSNLLTEEQVHTALEKFRAVKTVSTDAKPFAEYLVRNKHLTVWQAEKVLQGKHKGFFLGRYRLLSLLGKGGMSSVYLAEHTVMKRHCALKVLPAKRVNDASYLGRFHREAQAVAALDHPNIVRAYDVDMTTDSGIDIHFLAMEFVQGKSLLELVGEKGTLSPAEAVEIIRQSALGLEHAHRAGLVHRDIKPGNLLVTPTGLIKVLDLGLARFFDDEDASLTVQHDEKVLGTADYISPEQAIDSHKVDRRTDIYSLGCTFYFLLTGHPPFNTGSLAQRLVAHQTKSAPPISSERRDVPLEIQKIIEKMMAKKVDDRFQTAHEVVDAIALWQANRTSDRSGIAPQTIPPSKTTNSPPPPPPPSHRPVESRPIHPVQGVESEVKFTPCPEVAVTDDGLGDFLAGLSDTHRSQPTSTGAAPSESSSKSLSQAAIDTSHLGKSNTEVVSKEDPPSEILDLSLLDQVFDPTRLNLDSTEHEEITPPETSSDIRVSGTSPSGQLQTASHVTSKPEAGSAVANKLVRTPLASPWAWLAIGGGVLLVGAISWNLLTSAGNPPTISPTATPAKPLPSADAAVIEVGPQGHFTSIQAALDFVRENFRPLGTSDTRTIHVAGGFTYPESLQIHSGGRNHFPRNVTLKSIGKSPAVIQGDGKQPVLSIQETESLTIDGFELDGHGAATAVRIVGYSPSSRLQHLVVRNFQTTGVQLEEVAAQTEEEFHLTGIQVRGSNQEGVGIRCQSSRGGNTVCVQMNQLRVIGPLKCGLETSGTFWKSSITECVFAKCTVGIRFQPGTLIDLALVNNTLAENERGIVLSIAPEVGSSGLRVQHTLFSGNTQGDAVLEKGSATGLAELLLTPGVGRMHNRTDRSNPDTNGLDVFTGDGQRGASTPFVSNNSTDIGYLKPSATDLVVAAPADGAKGYIGAISP